MLRPMTTLRGALVALAVAVCLLPSARADAQARVVVEAFRGPQGAGLRTLLANDLRRSGWIVVEDDEVRDAARALGAGAGDVVSLARELRAAAFVAGSVSRARRSWRLTVRVRNGADGSELGSESWGGRTTAAMEAIGRTGAARLDPFLRSARAPVTQAVVATPPAGAWYAADGESPSDRETPPDVFE